MDVDANALPSGGYRFQVAVTKATGSGGSLVSSVLVRVRDTAAALTIDVEDDGKGLTPEERAGALKRGVRLDETTPGTGLGLSIVKELAELHRGSLELGDAGLGGLKASLRFPKS